MALDDINHTSSQGFIYVYLFYLGIILHHKNKTNSHLFSYFVISAPFCLCPGSCLLAGYPPRRRNNLNMQKRMSIQLTLSDQNLVTLAADSIQKIKPLKPNKYKVNSQVIASVNGSIHVHNVVETPEAIERMVAAVKA